MVFFLLFLDTKQDVEAVPISPTAAVHQGCSVGSKQDEVSKPHINDAFKHITGRFIG
ncbi:hypothetical protein DPMN_159083 [Dreissena polymorpha]|uniref:Uncharacterized protein n=1 Tax=Dreissena polymorpha TaxID=45954 RepID=A0A9D4EL11_DREPO|nr:hypothetical protein DPMN_159083 [Dreissena polymorpha]